MADPSERSLGERAGHVASYVAAAVIGYLAASEVLAYFYDRYAPDGENDAGNPLLGIVRTVTRGGFAVLLGVMAAVVVFVAITGVGGAVLSELWTRWLRVRDDGAGAGRTS